MAPDKPAGRVPPKCRARAEGECARAADVHPRLATRTGVPAMLPWRRLLSIALALGVLDIGLAWRGGLPPVRAEEPAASASPSPSPVPSSPRAPAPRARPSPRPPVRSFTDDDLERYRAERPPSPPETAAAASPAPAETDSTPPREPSGEVSGGSFSARLADLRKALASAEAARDETRTRVERLELRLNPMSPNFETDPNVALALTAELEAARARLADDEAEVERRRADLAALETQARREGVRLPPRE